MLKIKNVISNSIAGKIGILIDDFLLDINGNKINDEIDYKFYSAEDKIKIRILRGKTEKTFKIIKEFDDPLGIEFEEMKIFSCGADCIFCFVTQNPSGLRSPLYFKDGDFRMSFLYGNYITLTNTGPNALRRIVDQRLSPLYISVHSTIPEIRKYYLNLKKEDDILSKLKYLVSNGITLHTQIVLSPGINDGDSLTKTIEDLYSLNNGVESLAIVPVGLTKHRKDLPKLKSVTSKTANDLIEKIKPFQEKAKHDLNINWVYLSDEFYILAQKSIPDNSHYDDYPQIENGVGMCRLFMEQTKKESKKFLARLNKKRKVTFATGLLAHNYLNESILPYFSKIKNLEIKVIPIKNTLFGSNVTVSGLLSMKCLVKGLKDKDLGDLLVLPNNILNHEGIFLDDGTVGQLSSILKTKIYVLGESWKEFLKYLQNL